MGILLGEIDSLSIEHQSDLHYILKNHLIEIGVLESDILTEDQKIIVEDRFESMRKGESKGIPLEKVKEGLKKKYPGLNFKSASRKLLPQKLIKEVFQLPSPRKIELYKHLRQAAATSFQQFLQRMGMTEERWNQIQDETHIHFSTEYKREADEIRKRKGLK